jgi:hypothetical protein
MAAEDTLAPWQTVATIEAMQEFPRAPSTSLHLVDTQLLFISKPTERARELGVHLRNGLSTADFQRRQIYLPICATPQSKLLKRYPLIKSASIATEPPLEDEDLNPPVYVILRGHFCYISPQTALTRRVLKKMIRMIHLVGKHHSVVQCIVVFTSDPLLPYLKRRRSEGLREERERERERERAAPAEVGNQFIADGIFSRERSMVWRLLLALGHFKGRSIDNDCKIICLANVDRVRLLEVRISSDVIDKNMSLFVDKQSRAAAFAPRGRGGGRGGGVFTLPPEESPHRRRTTPTWTPSGEIRPLPRSVPSGDRRPPVIVSIQHFILPIYRQQRQGAVDHDVVLFQRERRILPGIVLRPISLSSDSISSQNFFDIETKGGRRPLFASIEPIVYRIELLLSSSKKDPLASVFHSLYCRKILDVADLVEITLGPVIGAVSQSSARIFIEVNMELRNLSCVLRPTISAVHNYESVVKTISIVKRNCLICFHFTDLSHGSAYGEFPNLFHERVTLISLFLILSSLDKI